MSERSSYEQLLLRDDAGVRHLTLNRPEARNAMSAALLDALRQALADTARDPQLRVLVLRGAGGHFCAGGDLKSMMASGVGAATDTDEDPIAAMNRRFGQLLREAEQLPQVLITVLEGAVLGGGLGLACVSDIAFAQADAKLGMPETTRGLPPAQIAPFVVTRIGLTAARRLALTGATVSGLDALRLGLVHAVFEDEAELDALLAAELAAIRRCAPRANALTKALMLKVGQQEMDALLDEAATTFAASVRGREAAEGLAAFIQKRPAAWTKGA
jgi:isohexenylglutaconyl-CoA hydratase